MFAAIPLKWEILISVISLGTQRVERERKRERERELKTPNKTK